MRKDPTMKYANHVKAALITTATVLAVIYAIRKIPVVNGVAGPVINKALMG